MNFIFQFFNIQQKDSISPEELNVYFSNFLLNNDLRRFYKFYMLLDKFDVQIWRKFLDQLMPSKCVMFFQNPVPNKNFNNVHEKIMYKKKAAMEKKAESPTPAKDVA